MRSALWRDVWQRKAENGESIASLSGRSNYTDEQVLTLSQDAIYGLKLTRRDSLLDVGCAAGFSGHYLASAARSYVGLDYSPEALRRLRQTFGEEACCGTAFSLPFRDRSFDKCHVGSVLLCLSREEACLALSEIRRVTRERAFVGGNLEVARDDGATHFSRQELAALADWSGWKHVEVRDLSDSLPHRHTMFDLVLS